MIPTDEELLAGNGGTAKIAADGGETVYDFGFRRSTPEEWAAAGAEPQAADETPINLLGDKVLLTDYARAANNGVMPPLNWQLTGSCVKGGGQNGATVRAAVEICLLPQAERFAVCDTFLAYALSRWEVFGDRSEGEGSSGAGMAKALDTGGSIPIDHPLSPKPHVCGPAIVYDRAVELRYSSIRNYDDAYKAAAKKHNFKWRPIRTVDDGVNSIRKGEPLTWAGDWGGLMQCPVKEGVLMNRRSGVWQHQQSCLGFWHHPVLGLIFMIQNQWFYPDSAPGGARVTYSGRSIDRIATPGNVLSVHAPSGFLPQFGEPIGSYWITAKEFEYQAKYGEVRGLSGFNGYGGDVGPGV